MRGERNKENPDPPRPVRWLDLAKHLGVMILLVTIGLAFYVRAFERRLIYYPDRDFAGAPSLPHEDVGFAAIDRTRLHGWFVPYPESDRVLIVSHGNAGNISHRTSMLEFLHVEFEVSILAYDYRGYGKSDGEPSEEGIYSDVRGAYAYVRSRGYSPTSIYLLGQSLGTAVAVDLAAEEPTAGLILEAPFTSVRDVARRLSLGLPVDLLIRAQYDSLSKIGRIHAPVAIVHARQDPVLPYSLGVRLFERANPPKRFFEVKSNLHEGALMGLGVEQTEQLRRFVFSQ